MQSVKKSGVIDNKVGDLTILCRSRDNINRARAAMVAEVPDFEILIGPVQF